MLERLDRKYYFSWKSGDGRCDFWIENIPIEVQGPHHAETTQQKHDEYKRQMLREAGFPDPVYIEGEDVKTKPDEVFRLLEDLVIKAHGKLKDDKNRVTTSEGQFATTTISS
jgi:hypothetical protein